MLIRIRHCKRKSARRMNRTAIDEKKLFSPNALDKTRSADKTMKMKKRSDNFHRNQCLAQIRSENLLNALRQRTKCWQIEHTIMITDKNKTHMRIAYCCAGNRINNM